MAQARVPVPAPTPATMLKKLLADAIFQILKCSIWVFRRQEDVDMQYAVL
jgi:hypothetical protein